MHPWVNFESFCPCLSHALPLCPLFPTLAWFSSTPLDSPRLPSTLTLIYSILPWLPCSTPPRLSSTLLDPHPCAQEPEDSSPDHLLTSKADPDVLTCWSQDLDHFTDSHWNFKENRFPPLLLADPGFVRSHRIDRNQTKTGWRLCSSFYVHLLFTCILNKNNIDKYRCNWK